MNSSRFGSRNHPPSRWDGVTDGRLERQDKEVILNRMAGKKNSLQRRGGSDVAVAGRGRSKSSSKLMMSVRSSLAYYGMLAASLACIILIWYVAATAVDNSFKFPFIQDVLGKIGYSMMDLHVWRSLYITMRRVAVGVLWGAVIGFPLGVAMGFSTAIMRTIAPFINSIRQIPTMCWVPLAVVWFGLGDGPTIFIIAFQAVFNVVLSTVAAVQDISKDYYNAVRSMGAKTLGVITDVVFPASMSGLVTGMRVSIGNAWGAVV